nr:30S ribosomal protein S3 [bacterium]
VADNLARQLMGRVSFRRAMKRTLQATLRMGAEGVKIMCKGRLGGAEMARTEQYKDGRIPLHTLRADIDYALSVAHTTYGTIGVKVWICKGEILGKVSDLTPNTEDDKFNAKQRPRKGGKGGGPNRSRGPGKGTKNKR